jgi:hypothetical protein
MSLRALAAGSQHYSHRVFDDIESLSYVLLLLCLQWMEVRVESKPYLGKARDMLFGAHSDAFKAYNLLAEGITAKIKFVSAGVQAAWDALYDFTAGIDFLHVMAQRPSFDVFEDAPQRLAAVLQEIISLKDEAVDASYRAEAFNPTTPSTRVLDIRNPSVYSLLAAYDAARAGPWDETAERLPNAQIEVMHGRSLMSSNRIY